MRPVLLILCAAVATLHFTGAIAANNLARGDGVVYASAGSDGFIILDANTGAEKTTIPRPEGFNGIHDLSVDSDLLFVLDAVDGSVAVFNVASPDKPTFVANSRKDVSVGPFAGVSAGGGILVVSGGTRTMSVFAYINTGALSLLTDEIDLGTGQPDVLVDDEGSYAYVSTDFSENVDGASFGITTVDLNSADISRPSIEQIGLRGSGFTGDVTGPANFPIESAISGNRLLVAHGGGLSVLSLSNRAKPSLTSTLSLDFPAVNVDADGDTAVVVGGRSKPAAARVNLENNNVENVELPNVRGAGSATGVALSGETMIIAAGPLIACDSDCLKPASPGDGDSGSGEDGNDSESGDIDGGSGSGDDGGDSGNSDEGDESDVCVEEEYLLSRGVAHSALLHEGSMANVLCPGHGLPCGTPSHVVRFAGSYMTYKELCGRVLQTCRADRKVVNGVSMRHARLLCEAGDEHCVVPHVMRTGFEIERALIRALHSRIVAH